MFEKGLTPWLVVQLLMWLNCPRTLTELCAVWTNSPLQQLRKEDELTHSVSPSRGRRTDPRTALLGLMDRLTVDLGGTLNDASLSAQSSDSTTPTQAHILLLFGPSLIHPKSLLSVHLNLPPSFDSSSGQASSTRPNTEKAFLRSLVNVRSSCPLNPAKALPSKSKTFVLVRASRSFKKSGWMPKHGLEQTLAGIGRRIGWEGLHVRAQEGDGDHTERVSVEALTTLKYTQGVADSGKAASLGDEDGMWFVWEGGGLEGWT